MRRMVMSESDEEDDTKPSAKEIREAEIAAVLQRQPPSPRKDEEYGIQEESILSAVSDEISDFDISSQLQGTDKKEAMQVHIEEKKKPATSPRRVRVDSGSDISDISLPLDDDRSGQRVQSPRQPPPKQPSPRVESRVPLTREASKSSLASETSGPSVTTTGFWTMVKAIDDDLPHSLGPERMYRSRECSPSIKAEIIRSANEGSSLDHLDPVAISMIVLHELPLLIRDMPSGCLIPDNMLIKVSSITNDNAKSYMFSSSVSFWEKLLHHFANLMKYHVMKTDEIAQKFAPLLISENSTMENKAIDVVQATLNSRDEPSESSSTLLSSPMVHLG
ncbi:uncharacterized protein [Ptychodera flava]|uniref:uncharacterized protein n=1 Tax=Ptychodera flava TaxID=63121 RepID=UPI00396A0FA7